MPLFTPTDTAPERAARKRRRSLNGPALGILQPEPPHHPDIRTWQTLDTTYVQAHCYECRYVSRLRSVTEPNDLLILKAEARVEWANHHVPSLSRLR